MHYLFFLHFNAPNDSKSKLFFCFSECQFSKECDDDEYCNVETRACVKGICDENYVNFLLASNTITKLDPRRINQHENPQEKHNVPNQQIQIVIPREIHRKITSQQYPNAKSKKNTIR